jgi:hypothetical protein
LDEFLTLHFQNKMPVQVIRANNAAQHSIAASPLYLPGLRRIAPERQARCGYADNFYM